jgi:hypothetical protein
MPKDARPSEPSAAPSPATCNPVPGYDVEAIPPLHTKQGADLAKH